MFIFIVTICFLNLSYSSLVKQARANPIIVSKSDIISFRPLINASHFRKHSEESDEYADLYCYTEQLLRQNYEWAVMHPKEVNTRSQSTYGYQFAPNAWGIGSGIMGKLGGYAAPDNGNLCITGGKITIQVTNFKFRIVKRGVEEIRKAGYNVLYSVTETGNSRDVANVEMGELVTAISISLV